ncbi:MAG: DNA/RNA nuclease SfsA [Candidatus Aminicenantes bacterium]|nr:MAG: DNA/RNA nuclease SfsA [Candidatus Aminicenantes bacterium]
MIPNVLSCRIVERINRFVVNIEIGGKIHKAHITNTGRLHEFLVRGRKGFCFETPSAIKTEFRLFAVEEKSLGALIDTQLQMKTFETAQRQGLIPWLKGAAFVRRNARLGGSLLDYLFDRKGNPVYLEVKSAVLREGKFAMYPDCPTLRGQRHVEELMHWVRKGGTAFILFVAALPYVVGFKLYKSADPRLFDLLEKAMDLGVQVKSLGIYFQPVDSFLYMYNPDLDVIIRGS